MKIDHNDLVAMKDRTVYLWLDEPKDGFQSETWEDYFTSYEEALSNGIDWFNHISEEGQKECTVSICSALVGEDGSVTNIEKLLILEDQNENQ